MSASQLTGLGLRRTFPRNAGLKELRTCAGESREPRDCCTQDSGACSRRVEESRPHTGRPRGLGPSQARAWEQCPEASAGRAGDNVSVRDLPLWSSLSLLATQRCSSSHVPHFGGRHHQPPSQKSHAGLLPCDPLACTVTEPAGPVPPTCLGRPVFPSAARAPGSAICSLGESARLLAVLLPPVSLHLASPPSLLQVTPSRTQR